MVSGEWGVGGCSFAAAQFPGMTEYCLNSVALSTAILRILENTSFYFKSPAIVANDTGMSGNDTGMNAYGLAMNRQ